MSVRQTPLRSIMLQSEARVVSGRAPTREVEVSTSNGVTITRVRDDDAGEDHVVVAMPNARDVCVPWHNIASFELLPKPTPAPKEKR